MTIKHRTVAQRVSAALKLTGVAAMALSFITMLALAGCPTESETDPPAFVAVTGISLVPVQAEVNKELTLTGTVAPENATNKTIEWAVKIPGTTGAEISNGKLTASAAGTVTVTATIANGASASTPYTGDFIITVYTAETLPKITSVTVSPASATVEKGDTQTFTAVVVGENNPSQAVSWSIVESSKKPGTGITQGGVLTVASDETLTSLTVKATSNADNTKDKTASVTVTPSASADGTWTKSSLTLTISGSTWTLTGMPDGNFTGTYTHPTLSTSFEGQTFSGTVSSITSSSMTISGFPNESGMNGTWTKQ